MYVFTNQQSPNGCYIGINAGPVAMGRGGQATFLASITNVRLGAGDFQPSLSPLAKKTVDWTTFLPIMNDVTAYGKLWLCTRFCEYNGIWVVQPAYIESVGCAIKIPLYP